MSKFTEDPYNNSKFPNDNFPYQFDIDKKIDEKFEVWAPVLISMLVKIAFETNGNVKDAKIVTEISDKYREGQDYISEFVKDKIIRKQNSKIRKTDLIEEFKKWYINNHGKTYLPNNKEIVDYMDKYYGKAQRGKWINVELCDEYSSDEDDE
jgi:phage/plasmid-associated DNA primase